MPRMPTAQADRNLLFAVLALQNEFVTRDQLVDVLNQWAVDKQQPIGDVIAGRGWIGPEDLEVLQRLVERQLERHESVEKSLDANSATLDLADTRDELLDDELREILNSLTQSPSMTLLTPRRAGYTDREELAGELTSASPSRQGKAAARRDRYRRDPGQARFSIVRSHARGGLGEVFLARDHELGREVALKEIQTRSARDEVAQMRFEMEACITGGLEHPGVVPVYAFGHYADGRPYYAMRFIRGESLKEEIERYHKLREDRFSAGQHRIFFRMLLRRFIDCCNAIGYAHSRGILHRDIKPANIMLGKYGETLVVDWGLAKTIGRDESYPATGEVTLVPVSGTSGSATVHGSTLGTPSFMSPEQAAGDIESLSSASDIYSLGSTLYTLLTGKPPYSGERARDIVAAVRTGNFKPPREVRSDVPRPMNAICLKAMALSPGDRYRTALDLAADIERFLGDEPVVAYPESSLEKTGRWLRRHRTLATAIGGIGVVTGIAALTGMYFINAEKLRTEAALQRVTVEQARTAAALDAESLARLQTREALNTVTDDLIGELMSRQDKLTAADDAFFSRVRQQFEQFTSNEASSPEQVSFQADGFFRIGNLQRRLGKLDEAEQAYESAVKLWTRLLDDSPGGEPGRLNLQQDLAAATANLGLTFAEKGNDQAALEKYTSAAAMFQMVVDASGPSSGVPKNGSGETPVSLAGAPAPDFIKARLELARLLGNVANTSLRLDSSADVANDFRRAVGLTAELLRMGDRSMYLQDHARLLVNYGGFLSRKTETLPQSAEQYRNAIAGLEELVVLDRASRTVRQELALTRNNLGLVLWQQDLKEEGLKCFEIAVQENAELVRQFPGIASNLLQLGRSQQGLATALAARQSPDAGAEYSSAISTLERLNEDHPNRPLFQRELATALDGWGRWSIRDNAVDARAALHRALEMRRDVADGDSATEEIVLELIGAQVNLANYERVSGNFSIAAELYRDLLERIEARPNPPEKLLRPTLFGLADSLVHIADHAAALKIWERLCANRADRDWARFELQRAICLSRTGKPDEGIAAAVAVAEQPGVLPVLIYDTACCCAVVAEGLGAEDARFDGFRQKAVAMLRRAREAGFFDDEAMKKHAAVDGDLVSLRSLPEFRDFCRETGIELPPDENPQTEGDRRD